MSSHDRPWSPQQGPGQQPYPPGGYPRQPGWGGRPPKKPLPWAWLIPVLALVVTTAVVVPIVLFNRGGSDNGGPSGANGGTPAQPLTAWQVTPAQLPDGANGALGIRTFDDDVVAVTDLAVAAYTRASGKPLWTLKAPDGGYFCGIGSDVVDDQLAVGFGPPAAANGVTCTTVGLVSLRTGQFAWTRPVSPPADDAIPPDGLSLLIAGNQVWVGDRDGVSVLSLTDGASGGQSSINYNQSDTCDVTDMAASDTSVYVATICDDPANGTPALVAAFNPATGRSTGNAVIHAADAKLPTATGLGTAVDDAEILSASPLVVLLRSNVDENTFYAAVAGLTDALRVSWSTVQQANQPGGLDLDDNAITTRAANHRFYRAVVANGLVYLVTAFYQPNAATSARQLTNTVVALDAATGQQRWSANAPSGVMLAEPVGVDGGSLLVGGGQIAQPEQNGPAFVLARFDAGTGRYESMRTQALPIADATNGSTLLNSGPEALVNTMWLAADGRGYAVGTNRPLDPTGQPLLFSVG